MEDELTTAPVESPAGREARAGLWAVAETWGLQITQFLLFLVLARRLGPEVYGLIALAMTINIVGEALIAEGGWIEVIVQRRDLEESHLDSAFWALLATGFALTLLACAGAPILAAAFSEPALLVLVPALSVALPLRGAGIVPEAILCRGFRFRPLAIRTLVATTVAGLTAIGMAFAGAGVWSLVAGQILQPLIGLALVWRVTSYRPRAGLSRAHLRSMLPFVGARLADRLLIAVDSLLPRLAIGAVLGAVALGQYTLARKVIELATQLLIRPLTRVAMSSLSAANGQPDELRRAIGRLVPLGTVLAAPALAGLAIVAPDLVALAFGSEWLPAVPAIAVLALLGATVPASRIFTVLLFAAGRPGVQLAITAPGVALLLAMFVIAPPVSLAAAAGLIVLRHLMLLPWQVVLTRHATGLSILSPMLRALPALVAAAVMTVTVLAVRALPIAMGFGTVTMFAGSVALGIVVFAVALLVLARPLVGELATLAGLPRRGATL